MTKNWQSYVMWGYFKDNPKEILQAGIDYLKNNYQITPIGVIVNSKYQDKFTCEYKTEFYDNILNKVIGFILTNDDWNKIKQRKIEK